MDVAMNAHGIALQRAIERPIMSSLHGAWSIGGMVGAALSAVLAQRHVNPAVHFLWLAILLVFVAILAKSLLLSKAQESENKPTNAKTLVYSPDGTSKEYSQFLWLWCTICFLGLMCEGGIADWSALYLQCCLQTDAGFAALGFSGFSMAMSVGRLCGDSLMKTLGIKNLLCYGSLFTGCVIALIVIIAKPWVAIVGFAIAGICLSTLAPIVYSSAGSLKPGNTANAVAQISIAGYCGGLVGPPLLGFAAQSFGFAAPMIGIFIVDLVLCLFALLAERKGAIANLVNGC